MSQENVEIVRAVFGAFDGINIAEIDWSSDAIREIFAQRFAPDVELMTLASGLGTGVGQQYRGWDGLVRYLTEWLEPFSQYHVENVDYIDAGDFVLIPSRQWGIGAGSGVRVELELTTLYEIRDGRIKRIHQFEALQDARVAAGSS